MDSSTKTTPSDTQDDSDTEDDSDYLHKIDLTFMDYYILVRESNVHALRAL